MPLCVVVAEGLVVVVVVVVVGDVGEGIGVGLGRNWLISLSPDSMLLRELAHWGSNLHYEYDSVKGTKERFEQKNKESEESSQFYQFGNELTTREPN